MIFKTVEFNKYDLDGLRDVIYNIFDISVTDDQLSKLLTLTPDWDGIVDTLGKGEFANSIVKHFIGLSMPKYGSPQEYTDNFWQTIEENKQKFIDFIE